MTASMHRNALRVFAAALVAAAVTNAPGQCVDGTDYVYAPYGISRLDGNTLRLETSTVLVGNHRDLWIAYVESWFYKNGNAVGHQPLASPGYYGWTAWQSYEPTLQVYGEGTFGIRGFHAVYTPYCGGILNPPYANGWDGYDPGYTTLILRPTLYRSDPPPFYLGGAITSGTYTPYVTLSSDPRGAVEVPTYRFLVGGAYGVLTCGSITGHEVSCWTPVYTATRAASGCDHYDVTIVASYAGFDSYPLGIFNNAPNSLTLLRIDQKPLTSPVGWETDYVFKVMDMCQRPMNWIAVNEDFPSGSIVYPQLTVNWHLPQPLDPSGWPRGVWDTSNEFNAWGDFTDFMFEYYIPGKSPAPQQNGANAYREDASSTVTTMQQIFRGASTQPGFGMYLRGDQQTHYLDHGSQR